MQRLPAEGGDEVSTRYVYQTTITVTVEMADRGELDAEGDFAEYDPLTQEDSAREWAEQAMPVEFYPEKWVTVDAPPLKLIRTEPVK